MKLLVLGGTKFLGRAFVEAALAAGHELTLFNRGETNPELFPDAERLRGDRLESLDALAGREWGAVLDMATFLPRAVHLSTGALGDRVGLYVYVSSISAYADQSSPRGEDDATGELEDPDSESPEHYGPLKATCERIVQEAYGERALVVRPGLIVGPHDPTDRFTYWLRRVAEGGDVLAPGSPDDPVQFIDVRDLADWLVRSVRSDLTGLYNTTGQADRSGLTGVYNATGQAIRFEDFLEECRRATGSDARFRWIPSERLLAAGVGEWMELPLWIASPEFAAMQRTDVSKALAAGLTFRPLADTIRDTLAWDAEREWPRAEGVGLAPERERELLAGA